MTGSTVWGAPIQEERYVQAEDKHDLYERVRRRKDP